jgi:hypothetical protein
MEGFPNEKFFNTARGWADETLLIPPPFSFPGVTARVFPLRASMNILYSFCQRYLNVAPPEVCELQPYLPFVLLVILDYGEMAIETGNMGWVSQHEVFFAVPLERWRRHRGRRIFEGWVLNTPFIFVDNAASLTTGREVYGWPKVLASLRPSLEEWLVDPRDPTRLLSLSVKGFGSRDAEKTPLLEIDHGLCQNPSLALFDLAAADPFRLLSRFTRNTWLAGVDCADILLRSPFSGFGPLSQGHADQAEILFASLRQLVGFLRDPGVDVVTLKQFRDAKSIDESCYQSLVKSRLSVDRVNRGGPLGLYNLLQGDASGGYRIRLYDLPSLPIAASLGLEAVRERTACGRKVSLLEPLFPSWMSVDLTYGKGENLGWRTHGTPWFSNGDEFVGSAKLSYDTVAGAAQQDWVGPLVLPKVSCDVFPLRVYDPEALGDFIRGYLNHGEPDHFEPWGPYVYMVASRSRMFSQARSAEVCEIAFFVPLLWYTGGSLKGFAVAKPFAFVDDPTLAMTLREVQGVPAMDATITTPEQSWLRQGPVLRMQADVFTVLEAGMKSERRTVIEVCCEGPSQPAPGFPDSCGPAAIDPALFLGVAQQILSGQETLQVLTLKQFRDAANPARACYQALVLEPWTLSCKAPNPLVRLGCGAQVLVHRYPSLPLAKILGLVEPSRPLKLKKRKGERVIADVLTPDDPFRIELDIDMGLAEVIARTAGSLPWTKQPRRPTPPGGIPKPPAEILKELEEIEEILLCGPQLAIKALLDPQPGAPSPGGRVGERGGKPRVKGTTP